MWFLLCWGLGIVTAVIHLYIIGMPSNLSEVTTILLLHQFVVTFGLIAILGVAGNIVFADKLARKLKWPGGPFQIKYGFSQLGLGVMGVLAIWFRGFYWVGVLVTMYIYGISGFWTHTAEMIKNKKLDAYHIGSLIMDVVYQAFITVLSILAGGIWLANSKVLPH